MLITVFNDWAYIRGPNLRRGDIPGRTIDVVTSFKVPGYWHSQKYRQGLWDGSKFMRVKAPEMGPNVWKLPSGLTERATAALDTVGIPYDLEDHREFFSPEPVFELADGRRLDVEPWTHQKEVVEAAISYGRGVISLPTAGGKSSVAAALMAAYDMPSLFLVDKLALLYQAKSLFESTLAQPIGIIGDSEFTVEKFTVATIQSLHKYRSKKAVKDLLLKTGLLILDECHHSAPQNGNIWTKMLQGFQAPHRFGLTATPPGDIQDAISGPSLHLVGLVGPEVVRISIDALIASGALVEPRCWTYELEQLFLSSLDYRTVYSRAVVNSDKRADICQHLAWTFKDEGVPTITLVKQIKHGQKLEALYIRNGIRTVFLQGKNKPDTRREVLAQLQNGEIDHVVATGQIMGEGIDIPKLGAVIDATGTRGGGSSTSGKVDEVGRGTIQALGRSLRSAPGKTKAEFVTILDRGHKSLSAASDEREQALIDVVGRGRVKPWSDR